MILILLSSQQSFATHAAGSDIQYTCLGGNQYQVVVTFYRDCGGVAEPGNITINCKSVNGSQNFNVTANKSGSAGNGDEITVPCVTSASSCGGGSTTGIRKWIYTAVVTLPTQQTDWVFSYSVCCRNCAITTINSPCASNSTLYIEALLNNTIAPCNSSPVFSNIPIAFVCIGQTFNFNHGVVDPDGDSLAYQLITPKTSATGTVSYIAPASATSPIASSTPFTMNPTTGDLTFTPSSIQIGIMAIKVTEYRNGVVLGSVIRDMQIYTTACTNNLPTASGIDGTNNYNVTVCPNQQVCFTVNSADLDASQNVTITSNNAIPGATYTISSGPRPTLTFCWTPTVNDINLSPNTFTITVRDNACPNNGIQTYSYNIYVPSPYFNVISTNISCNGAATGTAAASPVYSGNYTYNWNTTPTSNSPSLSGLTAGSYTVTVTDISGCSAQQTVNITEPSGMTLTSTKTNPSCSGVCNGTVDLSVVGGMGPYTYLWNNGQTSQDLTNTCAGTYTVTVTDANGCTKTRSETLTNSYAMSASASAASVACFGNNTGTVTLSVTGGVSPLTYSWSNGSVANNLSNVIANNYSVTITDVNGCTAAASASVTQPTAALNITTNKTNILCYGNSTGAITSTVSGGTSPYTYSWSNGNTTASLSGINAGTYTLTVTDNRGCTATSVNTLSQPTAALTLSTVKTNVKCFGNSTGNITVTAIGGTTPYTYQWNTGSTASALNNIPAGVYTITVTDANACTSGTTTVTITQPSAALNASALGGSVNCFGNTTANVVVNVTGGTTPYSYLWNTGSTASGLSNVGAGNYSVTITDANNCSVNASASITQPAAALNATTSKTNVLCYGNNTGAVSVAVTGGTTPYTYNWNNGATTASQSNMVAGTYNVTITDAKGCTTTGSATITQPAAPISISNTKADVKCFGGNSGSANVLASGGNGPYSYLWSNGQTGVAASNLVAGNYTVTVTDANACTSSLTITITQPTAGLTGTTSATNVKCFGNSTGSASITVSGGTPSYSYVWSNGNGSATTNNLTAGNYTVTVTDVNNCSITKSVSITQPAAALTTSTVSVNIKCFGQSTGAVQLTVSGGTTPYSYNWSNGTTGAQLTGITSGTYSVTVTDANSCTSAATAFLTQPAVALAGTISSTNVSCRNGNNGTATAGASGGTSPYVYSWNTGASTSNISNLTAGTYTVTITDANSCTTSLTTTVTQPSAAIALSATHTDVSCLGVPVGTINLTVSGGTTPYTYAWNNGSAQEDLNNLSAGIFVVTVTDANGCTSSLSEAVSQPAGALNATATLTNTSCHGDSNGAIDLNPFQGTPPYTYSWSNGSNSQDLTNLTAGAYTVTVTDVNGCILLNTLFVTQPLAVLSSTTTVINVACNGNASGTIDLTPSGGTTPYTFNWSNGASSEDITNLNSGNYTVQITDANGCQASNAATVNQPTASLNIQAELTQLNCHDVQDGAIAITVTGGTAPYTYLWNDGNQSEDLTGLNPGTYSLSVTDAQGCTASGSYTIAYAAATLSSTGTVTHVLCHADQTGAINIEVLGGTIPYSYNWNDGAITEDRTTIPAGNYSVLITDINGCTTTYNGSVNQPAAVLGVTNVVSNSQCFGDSTGTIDLSINGGTANYAINWNTGATSEDLLGLTAGTYDVTVTDANGCSQSQSIIVEGQQALLTAAIQLTNPACYGDLTGSITSVISGGTPNYSISWNSQSAQENIANLAAGTYTLNVIDAHGCVYDETVMLEQPQAPLSTNVTVSNVDCNSNLNGGATLTTAGGTGPYVYSWSNGATTNSITGVVAGNYQYTITDDHLCTINGSVDITEPLNALSASAQVTNVNCFSDGTGAIDLSIIGGTPAYSYNWSNGATSEDLNNITAGTYTVTVTDVNGCNFTSIHQIAEPFASLSQNGTITQVNCFSENTGAIDILSNGGTQPFSYSWNNGSIDSSLVNLTAGTYTLLITDLNGCTSTSSYTITEPTQTLAATNSASAVDCNGNNNGQINLSVTGGTQPYNFIWSNGFTGEDPTGLIAGQYQVTITDTNGCTTNSTADVLQPSAAVDMIFMVRDVSCFGENTGMISTAVSGGTAPYTYQWSNGATIANLPNLAAGVYTVTVTDVNGCSKTMPVSVSQPVASVSSTLTVTHITCNGAANGSIDLTVIGGMGNYTYQWNNGLTMQDPQNMSPGTYTVVISDQNGCSTTNTALITQPAASLSLTASVQQVSCNGTNNGGINLNINGGTAPYNYVWSTGAVTANISGLAPGTYSVSVTDANGCSSQFSASINQPTEPLNVSSSAQASNCLANQKGSIFITASGGTTPYAYLWNTGDFTQNLLNQLPGTYTVTISDANGCEMVQTAVIADSSDLQINTDGINICMGSTATLNAQNVASGVTLQWMYNGNALNGANATTFITPVAGIYTLQATTSCGVYMSNPIEIIVRSLNTVSISNTVIICPGESVQLNAGGGGQYTWNPTTGLNNANISNPMASPSVTTDYTVIVKDSYGCTATASVTVNVICDTLDIPNGYSPNGDGTNDTFVIDGLSSYPGNVLFIYNRWGNLIYKKKEYDNSWNGRANVTGVMFGEELPNGTYFYILDLNINEKPLNGFVVLRR